MNIRIPNSARWVAVLAVVANSVACSSDGNDNKVSAGGNAGVGGSVAPSGGLPGTGGKLAMTTVGLGVGGSGELVTGGTSATTANAGATSGASINATGGAAWTSGGTSALVTGGAPGSGGAQATLILTGGAPNTGGSASTPVGPSGGSPGVGGSSSSSSLGTGGATSNTASTATFGGASSTGGATATGGAPSIGGTGGTGGTNGTGGSASSTGGISGTGGATAAYADEQILLDRSPECLSCARRLCGDWTGTDGCAFFAGTAPFTAQLDDPLNGITVGSTVTQEQACINTLKCLFSDLSLFDVRGNSLTSYYCGTVSGVECLSPDGGANGLCVVPYQIGFNAYGTAMKNVAINDFTNGQLPAGAANNLLQCLNLPGGSGGDDNCQSACNLGVR